ncbi:MAG: class I SAM-dependent methyltransferase [Burkholderiales bacterium]
MMSIRQRAIAVLAVLLCAAAASASAQSAPPAFEPEPGRPGKDVLWLPTQHVLVERMLDIARVRADDVVYDLGSGDGRTVIAAAQRGARAVGIEYDATLVEMSKRNAAAAGVADRASFRQADLFTVDLSEATVITLFLGNGLNLRLRPTLLALAPGTRVVSNTFMMDDWEPDVEINVAEGCEAHYYCRANYWTVPARVEGRWRMGAETLRLRQKFQKIGGHVLTRGAEIPITDAVLSGASIRFVADGRRFAGVVSGDAIEGTAQGAAWKATRVRP